MKQLQKPDVPLFLARSAPEFLAKTHLAFLMKEAIFFILLQQQLFMHWSKILHLETLVLSDMQKELALLC